MVSGSRVVMTMMQGDNISLKKQIKMFRTTVRKYMPESFKTKKELKTHLSRSIFLIHIGSNDYINNFLQPRLYNSSRHYNANQFAQVLAHQLGTSLKVILVVAVIFFYLKIDC